MALGAIVGAFVTGALTYAFTGSLIFGVLMGALSLVSYLFTPKPKPVQRKPASLADFQITQVQEGAPVPLVYGTVKLAGTMLWYGNLVVEEETEEVGGKWGGDEEVVVGYRYYIDMWQAICQGKVRLIKMFIDDDMEKEVSCSYHKFNNGTNNEYPSELNLEYANRIPGVAHIFFKRFYVGLNRQLVPNVSFIVSRELTTGLPYENFNVTCGSTSYTVNNPAAIVYDLLLKAGIRSEDINYDSFVQASNYFYNKGWGLSLIFSSVTTLRDAIDTVLNLVDAYLDYDDEGRLVLKIFKPEDTPVATIEDDFIEFNLIKESWANVPNQLVANYTKCDDFSIRTVIWENAATTNIANKRNRLDLDLSAFLNYDIVLQRLVFIGKRETYPKITLKLRVPIKYSYLSIGDVVKIKNSDINLDGDFRVISVTEPKIDSNEIDLELVQHSEAIFDQYYRRVPETGWKEPTYELKPFTKIRIYELNYIKDLGQKYYLIAVNKETGYEEGFMIYVSLDGTSYEPYAQCATFSTYGTLVESYPDTTDIIDDDVGIIFRPYKMFETYYNLTRKNLFLFSRLLLINNELMTFQNINPYGETDYRLTGIIRGLLWTTISSHANNSPCWIIPVGSNLITFPFETTFYVKIVPIVLGQIGSLATATAITVTPSLISLKPEPPDKVEATRVGSDLKVDVFVKTKTLQNGAGQMNADIYTDQYPFPYEGVVVCSINNGPEMVFNSPNFVIPNVPTSSFTLKVWTRWNSFNSQIITLNIP